MENKIKEVQDYFANKILHEQFEVTQIQEFFVSILIDKKYKFDIWVGREDSPNYCNLWDARPNFIQFQFDNAEHIRIHESMIRLIKNNEKMIKAKQIADLEKQLAALRGGQI